MKRFILVWKLGQSYKKGLKRVFKKELEEEGYLNQRDYPTARDRVIAGVLDAAKENIDILTLAVAKHRQDKHEEDREDEIAMAAQSLETKEIDLAVQAESSGWSN